MQSTCRGCVMMRSLWFVAVGIACMGLGGVAQCGEKQRGQLPPDLRTRKGGNDWPVFLGPTGDSISTEKGLVTPWTPKMPGLVWDKKLGSGYGPPAISRGRLFVCDREGKSA